MKRMICILLACTMLLLAASCTNSGKTGEDATREPTTQLLFAYPTKESFEKGFAFQAQKMGLELPEVQAQEDMALMHFYTYAFTDTIKVIVKIEVKTNTVMNVEIDTPKTALTAAEEELLGKLMKMIVACVEPRETADGIDTIAQAWRNAEINGGGYVSTIGIVYCVQTLGEEDMLLYYAKL